MNTKYIAGARKALKAVNDVVADLEKVLNTLQAEAERSKPAKAEPDVLKDAPRRTKIVSVLRQMAYPAMTPSGEASGHLHEVVACYAHRFGLDDAAEAAHTRERHERMSSYDRLRGIISAYLSQMIKKGYVGRQAGLYYLTYEGMKL